MSCGHWRDALTDAAAAQEVSPGLRAHLEECGPCRAEKVRMDALFARMEAELEDSLQAAPSLDFVPRVRRTLAARPQRNARPPAWLLPAAVAAGIAVITFVGLSREEPRGRVSTPVERADGPPATFAPAPEERARPAAARELAREPRTAQAVAPSRVGRRPEGVAVLVPPAERIRLRRLMDELSRQRLDPGPLTAEGRIAGSAGAPAAAWFPRESDAVSLVAPLEIAPLSVVPLPEEGL